MTTPNRSFCLTHEAWSRLVVDDRPCVRCVNADVPFRDVVRGMLSTGGA